LFTLGGVAGYLFRPLPGAVVFALIVSYILWRTLVPTLANYLLRRQGLGGPVRRQPRGLWRAACAWSATPWQADRRIYRFPPAVVRPCPLSGPELLSERGWGPDQDACAGADRNPH